MIRVFINDPPPPFSFQKPKGRIYNGERYWNKIEIVINDKNLDTVKRRRVQFLAIKMRHI